MKIVYWLMQVLTDYIWSPISDVVIPLKQAWKEVEDPQLNEEMKNIINKYHLDYLKYTWNVFCNFVMLLLSINIIGIMFFMDQENLQNNTAKFMVSSLLVYILIIKWITKRYLEAYRYVFPSFIIIFGSALTVYIIMIV